MAADPSCNLFAGGLAFDPVSMFPSGIGISGGDQDVQFSDITIGADGRTYLTWVDVAGELQGVPQQFTIKMRIADPGSTDFGATRVVAVENLPIPFNGFLHSEDFRVATYPKSTVAMVNGHPRIFVVWEGCKFRPMANICEEP